MSEHKATIKWARKSAPDDFAKGKYSREHTWTFDGGVTVPASPSPSVVPVPWSNPAGGGSRGGLRGLHLELPHAHLRLRGAEGGLRSG